MCIYTHIQVCSNYEDIQVFQVSVKFFHILNFGGLIFLECKMWSVANDAVQKCICFFVVPIVLAKWPTLALKLPWHNLTHLVWPHTHTHTLIIKPQGSSTGSQYLNIQANHHSIVSSLTNILIKHLNILISYLSFLSGDII